MSTNDWLKTHSCLSSFCFIPPSLFIPFAGKVVPAEKFNSITPNVQGINSVPCTLGANLDSIHPIYLFIYLIDYI